MPIAKLFCCQCRYRNVVIARIRCDVMPGSRRGTVAFVGEVAGLAGGWWVGVRLDEPLGKSSGTIKGIEYFDCPPNYGAFVRGHNVNVGDFPVQDFDDDEDDDAEVAQAGTEEKTSTDGATTTAVTNAPAPQKPSNATAEKVLSNTTKAMLARARMGSDDINDDDDEDEI